MTIDWKILELNKGIDSIVYDYGFDKLVIDYKTVSESYRVDFEVLTWEEKYIIFKFIEECITFNPVTEAPKRDDEDDDDDELYSDEEELKKSFVCKISYPKSVSNKRFYIYEENSKFYVPITMTL